MPNNMSDLTLAPRSKLTAAPAATVKDAAAPFDNAHADIILRSSDGIDFRVSKFILSIASPVFADMFNLPQPTADSSSTPDETREGLPIIPLSEHSRTLDLVLRWCYPIRSPKLKELSDIQRILDTTQKYAIEAFDESIENALMAALDRDPVGVFAVAVSHGLDETAKVAAMRSLKLPLSLVVSSQWRHHAVDQHNALLQFHIACGAAASALTSQRTWFSDTPNLLSWNSPCGNCCTSDLQLSPSGSRWVAPRYLWRYLEAAGRILLVQPHDEAIAGLCVVEQCNNCRAQDRTASTKTFTRALTREVNAAIAQVPMPAF